MFCILRLAGCDLLLAFMRTNQRIMSHILLRFATKALFDWAGISFLVVQRIRADLRT